MPGDSCFGDVATAAEEAERGALCFSSCEERAPAPARGTLSIAEVWAGRSSDGNVITQRHPAGMRQRKTRADGIRPLPSQLAGNHTPSGEMLPLGCGKLKPGLVRVEPAETIQPIKREASIHIQSQKKHTTTVH